jgi:hypothetical protein|tara:strand:- start:5799 stop:6167 length:369 start_codon:yes stop_codon:yes gene_type:complete
MATPNIINVDTITPVTNIVTLANTSATGIIDVPAEYVAKVNSLIVCNDDGSNAATITAEISIDNGSNYIAFASTISVPADSSVTLIGKDNSFYLDETDLLQVTASAANDLNVLVSYDLIKDA